MCRGCVVDVQSSRRRALGSVVDAPVGHPLPIYEALYKVAKANCILNLDPGGRSSSYLTS